MSKPAVFGSYVPWYSPLYLYRHLSDGKIEFFDENKKFFEDSNLERFFGSSLKRIDEYFVVNL